MGKFIFKNSVSKSTEYSTKQSDKNHTKTTSNLSK